MRAVKLTDNVVTDIWEVPSLTCFEGVTLIAADIGIVDNVQMGSTYNGTTFTSPPFVDTRTYKTKRANEYPEIADQLDDIFHNGIDGWKATIQVTKDKYPK